MAQSKIDTKSRAALLANGNVRAAANSQPTQVRTLDPEASRQQAIAVRRAEMGLKPAVTGLHRFK